MVTFLISKAQIAFEDEKSLVCFEAPVKIFGDIHGQYAEFIHMIKELADKNKSVQQDQVISDNFRYLFMGDYVNRGK